jgi:hypothetical protein
MSWVKRLLSSRLAHAESEAVRFLWSLELLSGRRRGFVLLDSILPPKTENNGAVSPSQDSLMRLDRASTVSIW